uniref:Uncharacterized protein n=1 Tax=Chromera velia CCMP2878 TaxID=1169474 RepID=A0A0G4G6X1_9ALVE|eukprot:Cvel_20482.t1-p1 / transcript=Cvel_20482.t1 / gene=Cvel_20482 / organism=Chromera_velia_CCMP2878 / gene_product=hypothetical protein / transcript_product=hypothetical protein / location=Cvel_scaffold1841:12216-16008(-) / protein_length=248 / sequence_SO=supercontig / SO=protein_coding / is_pseudo=false
MPLRTYGGLTGGSFRSTGRPRSAVPSGGFYETSVMSPTRTRKVKEYQHVEEYDTELDHYHTHKPVHRKRELHHHHVLHHRENVHHENHFHHIHRVRHRHHVHHNHHHHHQRHIDEVHHHHHDHHHHQLHHYHDVHHHQEEHQKEEVHHAHDHHHMDEKLHRREVHHEHHVPGTMSATRDVRHLTHAPREDPRVLTTYAGPQMRTSTTYPARRSLAAVSTEDHRAPLPVTLPTPGPSAGYAVASRRSAC